MASFFPFLIILSAVFAIPSSTAQPGGLWLTQRKDSTNQARADVPGRMREAPHEVWRMATGGEVRFARNIRAGGEEGVLAQVGATLQLVSTTGTVIWNDSTIGADVVFRVDDFDNDGRQEALLRTNVRTVVLVDVETGEILWSWQSDPSTQIIGHVFLRVGRALRFICFPCYSQKAYCFDFSGGCRQPKLLWEQNFEGKYGVGYGPNIVLADMDADGKEDIVLSGKAASVYQAVLDADTGAIKFDVYYDVEGWGRPYGLLKATDLDRDGYPDVVMVCCQVEEYLAVARNVGGTKLEKVWGKFIEKDWPGDEKELRPQITSVADLQGNGRAELVVGSFENGTWQTLVIDPLKGFSAQRGSLRGCYFWGCYDVKGDSIPEIIVSTEHKRRPARVSTLLALDGKTLEPVASLDDAAVVTSSDSFPPSDTHFMALRQNPVFVRAVDGTSGILVRRFDDERRESGIFFFSGRFVAGPGFTRADVDRVPTFFARRAWGPVEGNRLLLSDARGGIQRFDQNLRPLGAKLATNGRFCRPLVWAVAGRRELVLDLPGGTILGGAPLLESTRGSGKWARQIVPAARSVTSFPFKRSWRVPGSLPALHIDATGTSRLSAVDQRDSDRPAVALYTGPLTSRKKPLRIDLSGPVFERAALVPYGENSFRLLVALSTGVHTGALAVYDASGALAWEDRGAGAYPNLPGAGDLNGDGDPEVVADDHGVLRIYTGTGAVVGGHGGWPPAYTIQVLGPFGPSGEMQVLRGSGILGLALLNAAGQPIWCATCSQYRYYNSLPAVADVNGNHRLMLGALTEDGVFECIDTSNGTILWSLPLCVTPGNTSVVSGDVDGNGKDEFVLGLPDGRLVCLTQEDGEGKVLWERRFEAAVANPIIADVDGDGLAEIVVSTADGYVRILGNR